jgi:uncharacterized membrane protein YjjP (DUF1212 family)
LRCSNQKPTAGLERLHYIANLQQSHLAQSYPQSVATVANAGVGAAVTMMFTSSWEILLITFVTGCIVDRVLSLLRGWGVPTFFQQLAAAGLIPLVPGLSLYTGLIQIVGVLPGSGNLLQGASTSRALAYSQA